MKRILLTALALAALMVPRAYAADDDKPAEKAAMKPIAVISIASYEKIKTDLRVIGEIGKNPDMAVQFDALLKLFTQGQGLAGLDQSKPWGAIVSSDGLNMQQQVFVPVTDARKLLSIASNALQTKPEDQGDGVQRLKVNNNTMFVKENKGWLFLSQSLESLGSVPENPGKLLGDLPHDYDVAVRVHVQNIPEVFTGLFINQLRLGLETSLQQAEGESDEAFEGRKKVMEQQIAAMETGIKELDELTIGWRLDVEKKLTYLDFTVKVVKDSSLAKNLAEVGTLPSKFGGFAIAGAIANMHFNTPVAKEGRDQAIEQIDNSLAELETKLESDDNLKSDEDRALVKKLVGEAADVFKATIKEGQFNGGFVVTGEGPLTLVGGGLVADGSKLEGILKELVERMKKEDTAPEAKFNVSKYKDVKFHTLTFKPDEDDDNAKNAKKLLGDPIVVTLGFGKKSAFVSVGPDAIDTIKKVMDGSESSSVKLPPVQFQISLAPLVAVINKIGGEEAVPAEITEALKDSTKDHIRLTASPIKLGFTYRLEFEEDALKLIGVGAQKAREARAAALPEAP